MAGHDHWIPFYVGDYLADTGHLSTLEHGAYLLLLFHYCRTRKPLPVGDGLLARIAKMEVAEWKEISATVLEFFTPCQGGLLQKRMAAEMQRSERVYKKRVEAGRNSAKKRKGLARSPSTQRKHTESNAPTQRGQTPHTTTTTKVGVEGQTDLRDPAGSGATVALRPDRLSDDPRPEKTNLHGVQDSQGRVCVHYPTAEPGKIPDRLLWINQHGGVDIVDQIRDLPDLALRKSEAIRLREDALENPILSPLPAGRPARKPEHVD